ncbi:MAG: putative CDP-diacylglycerol--glycerol-3-phosphate 3-phosphatidyltransferase [Streblomastix strix]|uniref:Putative CDP-diacylglycerol--glycerol-3-phosphate 3-phosphatidyltransferase n=1 Tax=Streblomastix strix TaxID=222440 RepID=A0A5J4V247_9EUKA|nr:MAG: putative CDP-diacylglycerol--glycerol-3-phosphate 3-phosphatidyltransferase [Streblomastix strix]
MPVQKSCEDLHVAKSKKRLLTLPNFLTVLRVVIIPIIAYSFFLDVRRRAIISSTLFFVASVTDFFDGYLARKLHQESDFGRVFDPIADKILVVIILIMLVSVGELQGINIVGTLIIVTREFLVSGLREYLSEIQVGMPVTVLAKWKTAIQMQSIFILVLYPLLPNPNLFKQIGICLLWTSVVLTIITGSQYFIKGIKFMVD